MFFCSPTVLHVDRNLWQGVDKCLHNGIRAWYMLACVGDSFPGSSHTCDLKIGTPVATLPGAWRYRVSAGTGCPGVSILWLGEMESLICNFYLSVAARKLVRADPSLSEIHSHVAWTLSNQQTTTTLLTHLPLLVHPTQGGDGVGDGLVAGGPAAEVDEPHGVAALGHGADQQRRYVRLAADGRGVFTAILQQAGRVAPYPVRQPLQ